MSYLMPMMRLMQATSQLSQYGFQGLQNGNAMQGMVGNAASVANKFGSDPSAMMASPEFAGLASSGAQLEQNTLMNGFMTKIAQFQAESAKRDMDKSFEDQKKLNMMA